MQQHDPASADGVRLKHGERAAPPLHVAFYCNLMAWPKRSHGGVRQWALALANGLVACGHEVDMLTEAPRRHFRDEPRLDPRVRRVLLGIGWPARRRLRAYAHAHPGVRIIAALDHYNIHAARLKRRLGDRVHVTLTQHEHLGGERVWMHPVMYRRLLHHARRSYGCADAVVAVSTSVADDFQRRIGIPRERMHAIYNPAYRSGIDDELRAALGRPRVVGAERPLLLAAGRLHYVKGYDVLLEAFARIRDATQARLVILGEGRERRALEAQVRRLGLQDVVSMPGRVASIVRWLAVCDVFVVSSRTEAMPTVLIEALALGRRIVCTDSPGGSAELLENGRWGCLVPPDDPGALARALAAALRLAPPDPDAARRHAAGYSLERALAGYLAVLRNDPVAA